MSSRHCIHAAVVRQVLMVIIAVVGVARSVRATDPPNFDFDGYAIVPTVVGGTLSMRSLLTNAMSGTPTPIPLDFATNQYTLVVTATLSVLGPPSGASSSQYTPAEMTMYEDPIFGGTPADYAVPATFIDGTLILSGVFDGNLTRNRFTGLLGNFIGKVDFAGGSRLNELELCEDWPIGGGWSRQANQGIPPGYSERWDGKVDLAPAGVILARGNVKDVCGGYIGGATVRFIRNSQLPCGPIIVTCTTWADPVNDFNYQCWLSGPSDRIEVSAPGYVSQVMDAPFPTCCDFTLMPIHCSSQTEIVSYRPRHGTTAANAWQSLGAPDRLGTSLGFSGELVLRFNQVVTDGPGPDLRVCELGNNVPPAIDENYQVEASLDNTTWTLLGDAAGGPWAFDLANAGLNAIRYIRISDLPPMEVTYGSPGFDPTVVGADIDAVMALHCAPFEADCANGADDDGDGLEDCQDSDCTLDGDGDHHNSPPCGDDCDDHDGEVYPGRMEDCFNQKDDDCDGLTNCADSNCSTTDSDGDGIPDCADPCPNRYCEWFEPGPGAPPNPARNFDIVVAADIAMSDEYFNTQLDADVAAIANAFFSLPLVGSQDKVTFWRYRTRAIGSDGPEDQYVELRNLVDANELDAVIVRAPWNVTRRCGPPDCTQPSNLPYALVFTDPQSDGAIAALHELGHAAFGLSDEYINTPQCHGTACTARASRVRLPASPANVWDSEGACNEAKLAYSFPSPPPDCYPICPVAWRWGDSMQNPNLMRTACESADPISVNGYGLAGNVRASYMINYPQENSKTAPSAIRQASSSSRRLTLHLRLTPTGAAADSVMLMPGTQIETAPPAGRPIYIDLLDRSGSLLTYRSIWDPRFAAIGDSIPRNEEIPISLTIGHPTGQRWRVMDRNEMTLAQGPIGPAFLDYCRKVNFTDADCFGPDADGDSIPDVYDNCPSLPNPTQIDRDGDGNPCEVSEVQVVPPDRLFLAQNMPNPFNPVTVFTYFLPSSVRVRLAVYDLHGREIAILADEKQHAGRYSLPWDGRNRQGQRLASGIYVVHLSADDQVRTRKIVLLK